MTPDVEREPTLIIADPAFRGGFAVVPIPMLRSRLSAEAKVIYAAFCAINDAPACAPDFNAAALAELVGVTVEQFTEFLNELMRTGWMDFVETADGLSFQLFAVPFEALRP
ncbi:MAG: hypothetical protein ACYCO4_00620 [Sulfobacillus sp.]